MKRLMAIALTCVAALVLASDALTGADGEVQTLFHQTLLESGYPSGPAALMTAETQVVRNEPATVQYVQTLIGGGLRSVNISMTPVQDYLNTNASAPIALDGGGAIYADTVHVSATPVGYAVRLNYFVPATSLSPEQLGRLGLPGLGPSPLVRQVRLRDDAGAAYIHRSASRALAMFRLQTGPGAPMAGIQVSMSDSFGGSGVTGTSINPARAAAPYETGRGNTATRNVSQYFEEVKQMFENTDLKNQQRVFENAEKIQQELAQKRASKEMLKKAGETAAGAGHVLLTAYEASEIIERNARRQRYLEALRKCAENPTNPLAKRAQKEDPNYKRSTTDAIADAARNVDVNSGIQLVSGSGNAIASTLLGHAATVPLALLAQAEAALLDHVVDDYIMKNAGKGVTPCEPDCEDDYSQTPSNTPLSGAPNAPQGSLTCNQSAPEDLVCRPGSSPTVAATPKQPPTGPTCGPLTRATFTYKYRWERSACSTTTCASDTEIRHYSGSADLRAIGSRGYEGNGRGNYHEASEGTGRLLTVAPPCDWAWSNSFIEGNGRMTVETFGYTGGSTPPADSFVRVSAGFRASLHEQGATCEGKGSLSNQAEPNDESVISCDFHDVDLTRPGFYRIFKDGEPASGVCTLTLSR